mgnify:CR=1 FL=1|tara:strand:+ start:2387 stop:2524 length:138 start_codon:yes stop_codon:yes gene_type:complete
MVYELAAFGSVVVVLLAFGLHAIGEMADAAVLVNDKRRKDAETEE